MNKKLLLVSLLAVGMLVGCGGGKDDKKDSTTPSNSPSSDVGGVEEGKYGKKGYYLIGTGNGWSETFWTKANYDIFYLAPVGDGTYSLTGSVTADDVKDGAKWEFKVRSFDGEGTFTTWFPSGMGNNGVITGAGEYKFVFNPNSTDKATKEDDGSEYTLYTKAERIGDAKEENRLLISTEIRADIEKVRKTAKLRISVEGLAVEEGYHVYVTGKNKDFLDGWKELTKSADSDTLYECSIENVLVGLGPLEQSYDLDVVISDKKIVDGTPEEGIMDGRIANPDSDKGVWTVTYSANKTTSSLVVDYFALHSTMTTDAFITYVDTLTDYDYKTAPKYAFVTGVVTEVTYNEQHKSYNITLSDTTEGKDVAIYSGALKEGEAEPKVGIELSAYGIIQVYNGTTYQVAYDSTNKVNPVVYNVKYDYLYVRGSNSGWSCQADYKLVETETDGIYSVTVTLTADTEFKLSNNTSDWLVQYGGALAKGQLIVPADLADCFDTTGDNIKVLKEGTYTFIFDEAKGEASVKAAA